MSYVLGVIAFPTAMHGGSPMQCTFCKKDLCPDHILNKMVIDTIIFYLNIFSMIHCFLG